MEYVFFDANGHQWVYVDEEERVVLNTPSERNNLQSGYHAVNAEEALLQMMRGGYMEGSDINQDLEEEGSFLWEGLT
jgi:hypothetical protein